MIYSYPDEAQVNKPLHIGVTLQYIKSKAVVDWVVFSNVSVYLKPANALLSDGSIYSENDTSPAISPGGTYQHNFSLIPHNPANYNVFLKLTALFGPGGGSLETYKWDANDWYNKNQSGAGNISPEMLHSLNVVNNVKRPNLTIRLQDPYGQIKQHKVGLCKANDNSCEKACVMDKGNTGCNYVITKNGIANFSNLSSNNTYSVIVPKIIDIAPSEIRATFSGWSDGQRNYHDEDHNVKTDVTLNSNMELLALYKIQYHLNATAKNLPFLGLSPGGITQKNHDGWYDSDDEATYSARSIGDPLLMTKFARWDGEVPTGTATYAAGSLLMNGPKNIVAEYEWEFTYIAVIVAAFAAIPVALEILFKEGRIKRIVQLFKRLI